MEFFTFLDAIQAHGYAVITQKCGWNLTTYIIINNLDEDAEQIYSKSKSRALHLASTGQAKLLLNSVATAKCGASEFKILRVRLDGDSLYLVDFWDTESDEVMTVGAKHVFIGEDTVHDLVKKEVIVVDSVSTQ